MESSLQAVYEAVKNVSLVARDVGADIEAVVEMIVEETTVIINDIEEEKRSLLLGLFAVAWMVTGLIDISNDEEVTSRGEKCGINRPL